MVVRGWQSQSARPRSTHGMSGLSRHRAHMSPHLAEARVRGLGWFNSWA